jgi:hypothetical protein
MLLFTWWITPEETKKETAALLEVVEGTVGAEDKLLTINGEEEGVHRRSIKRRITGTGLDLLTKKDYMM